jgi:hypothetical protein
MGGLARLSGGRIDVFQQINSGLSNDFVNDVECDPDHDYIWAATAMGASRLNLLTGEWTIFTEQNTPMHEPWTYSVAIERGLVYVGAWGGGVLEYQMKTGRWREYLDPDGEMEMDLLPDDGPVHDVTAAVDYVEGILWQATYFGAARYDGRRWRTFFAEDSGLASNFINFVRARGDAAWMATDKGLSATDGEKWITYRRRNDGRGEILSYQGADLKARRITPTAIAHNFVLGVDFQGGALWAATAQGVSRGTAAAGEVSWRERCRGDEKKHEFLEPGSAWPGRHVGEHESAERGAFTSAANPRESLPLRSHTRRAATLPRTPSPQRLLPLSSGVHGVG